MSRDRHPGKTPIMKPDTSIQCATREEWRQWLHENHASSPEVWLLYFKKHTGKQSVAYRESVEEALCFGWIDGLKRRVDDERYAQRFTPRKPKSKWSPLNISLAEKMIAAGKMAESGLAAFRNRIEYKEDFLERRKQSEPPLPDELRIALAASPAAMKHLLDMAPGYRKQYAAWIASAKRPETRQKRVEETIRLLKQNRKLGMK